jgi:hypothetical protein
MFPALLDIVDQVDRWLDELERAGVLPTGRGGGGARRWPNAPERDLGRPTGAPSRRHGGIMHAVPSLAGSRSATRRVPTAISRATTRSPSSRPFPGSPRCAIAPREPFGDLLDGYDPFACNLVIEAVSSADRAEIEAALPPGRRPGRAVASRRAVRGEHEGPGGQPHAAHRGRARRPPGGSGRRSGDRQGRPRRLAGRPRLADGHAWPRRCGRSRRRSIGSSPICTGRSAGCG